MLVPWKRRFGVKFTPEPGGWSACITFGFLCLLVMYKSILFDCIGGSVSRISLGWLSPNLKPGQAIPCWSPYFRVYHAQQEEYPLKG